ncbi:unnamed protein product, partial [Staurois parvus]
MPLPLGVMLVTVNPAMPHGTCSLATAGGPPVCHLCCQTTRSLRHCKICSYKHDSQRQKHDGTCQFDTPDLLPHSAHGAPTSIWTA